MDSKRKKLKGKPRIEKEERKKGRWLRRSDK